MDNELQGMRKEELKLLLTSCISLIYLSNVLIYDMIYLLTAIGLSAGGRSTVHIYTHTIHRRIQNKQYIEQHNNFGRVRAKNTVHIIVNL